MKGGNRIGGGTVKRKKWPGGGTKGQWLHQAYPHLYDANGKKKKNPARRKTARRKNAGSQSKLLKNFTGVVRLNADKTVSIVGTGRKPNPSKKRRAKR